MYPIIENMSASQTAELTKVPDCPHVHVKDLGIEALRDIVRRETEGGLKVVRFLTKAMDGEFSNYEPDHELEAAKILAQLGSDEAAEFVRSYGQRRRRRSSPKGERASSKKLASDYGQSDPYLVIEPVISDIARFIRDETSSGKTIVRRLIQIMETCEDPYKPNHNLSAARELLNRGWSMPNAIECSWLCAHHVSAEYFNGQKSQEHRNGYKPSKEVDDTTPSTAQDTENADTAQAAVAVEARPEPAEARPEPAEGGSPKTGFTDIDSLPERFWMRVLDLCARGWKRRAASPGSLSVPTTLSPTYAPSRYWTSPKWTSPTTMWPRGSGRVSANRSRFRKTGASCRAIDRNVPSPPSGSWSWTGCAASPSKTPSPSNSPTPDPGSPPLHRHSRTAKSPRQEPNLRCDALDPMLGLF